MDYVEGDIVRCEGHEGFWEVERISKGRNMRHFNYATVKKLVEDNYRKADKEERYTIIIELTHTLLGTSLIQ